jgi:hypothetical protein
VNSHICIALEIYNRCKHQGKREGKRIILLLQLAYWGQHNYQWSPPPWISSQFHNSWQYLINHGLISVWADFSQSASQQFRVWNSKRSVMQTILSDKNTLKKLPREPFGMHMNPQICTGLKVLVRARHTERLLRLPHGLPFNGRPPAQQRRLGHLSKDPNMLRSSVGRWLRRNKSVVHGPKLDEVCNVPSHPQCY